MTKIEIVDTIMTALEDGNQETFTNLLKEKGQDIGESILEVTGSSSYAEYEIPSEYFGDVIVVVWKYPKSQITEMDFINGFRPLLYMHIANNRDHVPLDIFGIIPGTIGEARDRIAAAKIVDADYDEEEEEYPLSTLRKLLGMGGKKNAK